MDASPGTYALVLQSARRASVTVGRLGAITLLPGTYIYVGSAFGPGGLAARVGRHCRRRKPVRWHIDYVRAHLEPLRVACDTSGARLEHRWAECLATRANGIPGFGSSDCACHSHFFQCDAPPADSIFDECSAEAPAWYAVAHDNGDPQ